MELNHFSTPQIPVHLDLLKTSDGRRIHVMRDDLLPGGSKQRAVIPMLKELKSGGVTKVTYASPFAGFAQVALAHGCREVGLSCHLFAEFDPTQNGKHLHPFSELAKSLGAQVTMVENLEAAEGQAHVLSQEQAYEKIPLGFQCESFQRHFQSAVASVLNEVRWRLGTLPARIWLPVGSTTLARTFQKVVSPDTELLCVNVRVLAETDPRIQALRAIPQVSFFSTREEFREKAWSSPPLPSNVHYDAKLWHFMNSEGCNGDLWWNVAR